MSVMDSTPPPSHRAGGQASVNIALDEPVTHDLSWATMVALYPDDFSDEERLEAQDLLAANQVVEVEHWGLSRVRSVQAELYLPHDRFEVLSRDSHAQLMSAARRYAEQSSQRVAESGDEGYSWFKRLIQLISAPPAVAWVPVLGLALLSLWSYQEGLISSSPVDLPASTSLSEQSAVISDSDDESDVSTKSAETIQSQAQGDRSDLDAQDEVELRARVKALKAAELRRREQEIIAEKRVSERAERQKRRAKKRVERRVKLKRGASQSMRPAPVRPSARTRITHKTHVSFSAATLHSSEGASQSAERDSQRERTALIEAVTRSQDSLHQCLSAELSEERERDLLFTVKWRVDQRGRSRAIKVDGPTSRRARRCILRTIKRWTFTPISREAVIKHTLRKRGFRRSRHMNQHLNLNGF